MLADLADLRENRLKPGKPSQLYHRVETNGGGAKSVIGFVLVSGNTLPMIRDHPGRIVAKS
jgi:hypothetical protein